MRAARTLGGARDRPHLPPRHFPRARGLKRADFRAVAVLLALHAAIVLVVQPRGDFPLNDDWAYAKSVVWLLDEGRVRLSDWIAMNLLPQTLAGGLVSATFGFSFETLRHLTQAVAALASLALYGWFRVARMVPLHALAAAIAVIAFPAWPVLANSYMTDLYALALAMPAAALFLVALRKPSPRLLAAATLLAAAGILQRQVVLALPVAFMVARLWEERRWTPRVLLEALAPVAAVLAAQLAYQAYLVHGPGLPEAQRFTQGVPMIVRALTNESARGEQMLHNALGIFGYLGLFCAGWGLWWGWGGMPPRTRAAIVAGGIAIGGAAFAWDWFPPYRTNMVLDRAGIGPFTLFGTYVGDMGVDRAPGLLWRAAGIAAAFGSAALAALAVANAAALCRLPRETQAEGVFLTAVVAIYLFPFVAMFYFDRYLLFVLPFVFALWARTWPAPGAGLSPRHALASLLVIATVALSSVATRDYFAWNRARWDAIRMARELGATPETLDGGFEFNGWYRSDGRLRAPPAGKSWWWVKDDEYIVAFVPVQGYEEVASFPVRRWLPRTPPVVRLLRRK